MKKIIIDTNFLLIPGKFRIDIFSEFQKIADFKYELFIIDKTIYELNKIINNKDLNMKDKLNAKIGLHLVEANKVKKIESSLDDVDDAIVAAADKNTVVATSDKELKRRLRENGVKILNLMKKQYLKIE
jgi:rRNA-processing protein FCF1